MSLVRSTPPAISAFFSPDGGCEAAVCAALAAARHTVRVQAYTFTSRPILAALNAADARGLDVVAIIDGEMGRKPGELGPLLTCPVYYDATHLIAHNKIVIIDGLTVITGSFNFSAAAEHLNAENLLVIRSKALAAAYLAEWEIHRAHSVRPAAMQAGHLDRA